MMGRLLVPGRIRCPRLPIVTLLSAVLASTVVRPPPIAAVTPECGEAWRERELDDGSREASQVTLALDVANNAYVARVIEGRIAIAIVGSGFETSLVIDEGPGVQSDPAVATTSSGVTFVAFSAVPGDTPGSGRRVFVARVSGGSLGAPRDLSAGDHDDHGPRIALDSRGGPHLVWTRHDAQQSRIVYWNDTLETPRVVADRGESPSLFVTSDGQVHIAYTRERDIAYLRGWGAAFEPERPVTSSLLVPETSPSVLVDTAGTVMIVYERFGSLYLIRKRSDGTEFEPPQLLEGRGVDAPRATLTRRGELLVGYLKDGDVFHLLGTPDAPGSPGRITETGGVEGQPTVDMDSNGTVHAAFLRGSVARYASNACVPDVDFVADPREGRVPLKVRFTDLSSQTAESWEWDFGDGGTSRSQNPEYTYQDTGVYTVRLRVSAPGGVSSTREVEAFISVANPLNRLQIPDQQVIPGHREMWFPVLATHVEPIQGFQLMGTYDPAFLDLVRVDLALTDLEARRIVPEFFEARIFETHFEVGCLFDLVPPFEGIVLPPSQSQRLAHLVFDVSGGAREGETTEVRLVNDRKISRIFNIFIVGGFNRLPALKGSTVRIRVIEPPYPKIFVRGDFDDDGLVTVSDGVALLGFLFQGGDPPACMDAADFGDTGRVDVAAASGLLNFLFSGGPAPLPPYPNKGLDPTEDDLGECR